MSQALIPALILSASVIGIITCVLIQVAMVAGINSKMSARTRFSYLTRDIFGLLREHRRLFPSSHLRFAFLISLCLVVSFGFAFVLMVR